MGAGQEDLVARVRHELRDRGPREVSMFGGVSFMVDDRMVAAARRGGDLLLRVDPADQGHVLAEPGAHQAYMGTGRSMGPGWISVDGAVLHGEALATWLAKALRFHAAQASS